LLIYSERNFLKLKKIKNNPNMKTIKIVSVLALAALIFACNKDDDKPAEPEAPKKKPAELILGSWNFVSAKTIHYVRGKYDTVYRTYKATDSLIYKADSTYSIIPSANYTGSSSYRFIGDSTLVAYGDTSKTLIITPNQLQLYTKWIVNTPGQGDYGEQWLDLKR
jgi:hypothetical protein